MYQGNEMITVCDHPLIKHKLTMLRNRHADSGAFRTVVEELALLLGYEALRDLELEDVPVETPWETALCPVIAGEATVIVPILRAGLGMSDGLIRLLPTAKVGHVGISRDPVTLKPAPYLCKLPERLAERKILAADPMLATGGSAAAAIDLIKEHGGRDIIFLCLLAAPEGLEYLHSRHPDIRIVVGHVDRGRNEQGYVCPGFGNAGERLFGTK